MQTTPPTPRALITGATAGIGAEFARQLAASGHALVLVARDEARLQERATEFRTGYGVEVEVLAADLVNRADLAVVEVRLAASGTDRVTVLINNAGFGLPKPFDENAVDDEQQLLDLLVTAPMRLTHAALTQMLEFGSGTIVNIASVAGYTPRGTYGAAKAWVLSFSRWANLSYRRRGITVTAVAPGFVHTEFHDRMNVSKDGIPAFLWLDVRTLVRLALRDVARGRAVSIPTLRYRVIVALAALLPARIVAAGALRGR
jgi:short-subunit dehydrogenase